MSLFAKHISASRKEGRVSVNLRNEDIDPLNGVVADAPVDTEVDEGPKEGAESDKFAAQRALLNKRHGMIRNRRLRSEEEEVVIEDAPSEEASEDEVIVDAPEGEDDVVEVTGEGDEVVEDTVDEDVVEPEVEVDEDGEVEFTSEEDDDAEEEDESEDADEATDDEIVDEIESDAADIEDLETEMQMLHDSIVAIESFGINPTAMAIMQSTGLLDGTALESLGLESIGYEGPKDVESLMATEALSEKIKEKAARMSAKILSIAKGVGSKTMTVLEALWGKITGSVKALASASWEGAKAAGRTVKAHPYKTIAAVIVAIGAVAGILAFTGTSLPAIGAKPAAMQSFLKSLADKVNKIQWPFGKVGAKVEGMKLLPSYANTSKLDFIGVSQPAGKLGWTQTVVKAVGGQLNRVWTPLKAGAKTFGARAAKIASSTGKMIEGYTVGISSSISEDVTKEAFRYSIARGIDKTTAKVSAAGVGTLIGATYFVGAVSVLTSIYKLVKWVVVGGFRLILKTFRTLGSLVGVGGKTAEATA